MKGILLAGGSGTRLYPITQAVNKHLLPIYNKPMLYYPLSTIMLAGINEVVIVVNPQDKDTFVKVFGDGKRLGMKIHYVIQDKPRGLADGLLVAEKYFEDGDTICFMLGDNIFFGHGLPEILKEAREDVEMKGGAYIFAYWVHDPQRYGIVEFSEDGRVISIEEKPKNPKSNFAVTGLYFFDHTAFEKARRIKPSGRGELEITSVNQEYLKEGRLKVRLLGRGFAWFDAGTYDSFLEAGEFVATIERKTGLMIGCVEEIAYRNGWINRDDIIAIAKSLGNTEYGHYLMRLAGENV